MRSTKLFKGLFSHFSFDDLAINVIFIHSFPVILFYFQISMIALPIHLNLKSRMSFRASVNCVNILLPSLNTQLECEYLNQILTENFSDF